MNSKNNVRNRRRKESVKVQQRKENIALFALLIFVSVVVLVCSSLIYNYRYENCKLTGKNVDVVEVEVNYGDSLWTIAKEWYKPSYGPFRSYVNKIYKLNDECNYTDLKPGTALLVPVKRGCSATCTKSN